jgi:hypothetical protein
MHVSGQFHTCPFTTGHEHIVPFKHAAGEDPKPIQMTHSMEKSAACCPVHIWSCQHPPYKTVLSRLQCSSSKLGSNNRPANLQFELWFLHDTALTAATETTQSQQWLNYTLPIQRSQSHSPQGQQMSLLRRLPISSAVLPALYWIHSESTFSGDKAAVAWSWQFTSSCWS